MKQVLANRRLSNEQVELVLVSELLPSFVRFYVSMNLFFLADRDLAYRSSASFHFHIKNLSFLVVVSVVTIFIKQIYISCMDQ